MAGLGIEGWNNLIVVCGIASGVLVVFTGAATYAAFRLQSQEAAQAALARRQYQTMAEEKISTANEAAARANERAARAEKAAAVANLELEKLRAARAPWDLSDAKRKLFVDALQHEARGKIMLMYTTADGTRASDFADALNRVLKTDLGFDVWGYVGPFTSAGPSPLVGVELAATDEQAKPLRDALALAFQSIGIPTRKALGTGMASEPHQVVVAIGIKPTTTTGELEQKD